MIIRCFLLIIVILSFISCKTTMIDHTNIKKTTNQLIDKWHKDVASYDFDSYFEVMSEDAVFIGTDASENWNKQEFMLFSKPFFEKKKTWDFKPLQRNIYISEDGKTIWFDELLNTWMKICRGSGVVVKEKNEYKIKHYVLSFTIPNDVSISVIKTKEKLDSIYLENLK